MKFCCCGLLLGVAMLMTKLSPYCASFVHKQKHVVRRTIRLDSRYVVPSLVRARHDNIRNFITVLGSTSSAVSDRIGTVAPTTRADASRTSGIKHDNNDSIRLLEEAIQQCWNATALTLNPTSEQSARVNEILPCLCSPAPQSYFAIDRAVCNSLHQLESKARNTETSVEALRQTLQSLTYLLKPGYSFVVSKTASSNTDGAWSVVPAARTPPAGTLVVAVDNSSKTHVNTLEISRKALTMVTEACERGDTYVNENLVKAFEKEARERLLVTLGTDIRGRTSADAAFNLALSGIKDPSLYRILTLICRLELSRIGSRPSFQSQFILQMVEKLAAAGVLGSPRRNPQEAQEYNHNVYSVAAACLSKRKDRDQHAQVIESLQGKGFDLHSPRSLLWLWRFSSRQTKCITHEATSSIQQQQNGTVTSKAEQLSNNRVPTAKEKDRCSWLHKLEDTGRPLIVDVGCGLGVSLLGLSTFQPSHQQHGEPCATDGLLDIDWTECNFVGCDLSPLSIGYARGIAHRWGLDDRVQFSCQSAQDLLDDIDICYPGQVPLILIQFPTPFRLHSVGNSQLPQDSSAGFMVTERLLQKATHIVKTTPSTGRVLLQSNCEDVAVAMKDMALNSAGLQCVAVPTPVTSDELLGEDECQRIPLRTKEWIRQGGVRAIGPGWSRDAFLPPRTATETEVACTMQETSIHRCLLIPSKESKPTRANSK